MNDIRHDAGEEESSAAFNLAILGASAGGVDALSRVVAQLPENPAFATVVLTHLDPHHDSHLAEVLQKQTAVPVQPLEAETTLEHGRIYVLPPGQLARLRERQVRLTPRPSDGVNLPIDEFMLSAARDTDAQLAGVVLSGTGSDGTSGSVAIKSASGLVIAQNPDSAAHHGMPQALIDDDIAHQVLLPEQIGTALQAFFAPSQATPVATEPELIAEALALVQKRSGLDVRYYKDLNVRRRLLRRAFLQSHGDL